MLSAEEGPSEEEINQLKDRDPKHYSAFFPREKLLIRNHSQLAEAERLGYDIVKLFLSSLFGFLSMSVSVCAYMFPDVFGFCLEIKIPIVRIPSLVYTRRTPWKNPHLLKKGKKKS